MHSSRCAVWIYAVWLMFGTPSGLIAQTDPVTDVRHAPQQPRSGEAVTITVTLGTTVEAMTLEYQVVEPGKYIALNDRAFRSDWQSVPMEKFHSDARYFAKLPASLNTHRRLIRYRFKGTDESKRNFTSPHPNSAEPNYAYFVYNGTPLWKAAINPKSNRPDLRRATQFASSVMNQVQNYILIAKEKDVGDATWHKQAMDKEYRHTGALVANGRVYDHIRFRARGGEWRYAMGKNMWKFDFHKSNRFQAYDDYGRPYKATWSKVNLRACIQQADYERRGEQGMFETVGFRLFNLAGVDAPRTHWISLRIISGPEENPADQYRGDYWGLYLAIENEDGRFLDEHDLPDGNIYKMKYGRGELENHGKNQPRDGSDLAQLLGRFNRRPDPQWWNGNVDLPRYYSYRSLLESIHHYDLDAGKNYTFYFNPRSAKWQVVPWDIDLTWGEHMFGRGNEPFKMPVLSHPPFRIEYQNRQREIRDLLFNPQEAGRLIDECAAIISRPNALSIVDADRAKWDYHPIMASRYVHPSKAGQGLFYESVRSRDFAGMVQQMKDFVARRCQWIDRSLIADSSIPQQPEITYAGKPGYPANELVFRASAFNGQGEFAAMKWRIGEVAAPDWRSRPGRPGVYEVTPVWESVELTTFNPEVSLPADVAQPGRVYRARVQMKDSTGRWSHWSEAIEFRAKAAE